MGVLLGGELNTTKAQMQAIIDFETRLANITIPSEQRRDEEALYNLMTIKQLQAIADFVRMIGIEKIVFYVFARFRLIGDGSLKMLCMW